MDLLLNYFVLDGRIDRATFWRAILIYLWALMIVVFLLAGVGAALRGHGRVSVPGPVAILGIVPISVRRLHDRGKSGWRLLAFYALPAALDIFPELDGFVPPLLASLAAFALPLWGLVELGCLSGVAGPNRYGPDPLAE
jgi:uncharacterized membrane protein YhaH (DUF805 family)